MADDITVRILSDVNALAELSSDWEQLWRQTPEVSAFQALEWILACAVHASHSDIYAMVLRADGEPLAIFPTRLSTRGTLSFIGAQLSNYCGPVYAPDALPSVVAAWLDAVASDPRVRSIDLTGLRERSPFLRVLVQTHVEKWGKPVVVEMFTCPEADLHQGWDQVFRRHKSRQRANWRRKWDSLAELGRLDFLETSDPDELAAVFPRLFELYEARWHGKRIRAAFGANQYRLQLQAAKGLGIKGLARLSLIRLDEEVIAFAYAMRGATYSTSYVLAHDAVFDVFSPGLLLLIKILEAATARGDSSYDFSLGEVPYKAMWATGEQRVFSVLLGRGAHLVAMKRRWWRAARSTPLLRRLKQEGFRGLATQKERTDSLLDRPGLSGGSPRAWHVYQVQNARQCAPELLQRPLQYSQMRTLFSPRLMALALDRHYRGDQALALEHKGSMMGAIWMAAQHRRSTVTGGLNALPETEPVYYHPVATDGENIERIVLGVSATKGVLVCPRRLVSPGVREIHTFRADLRFRRSRGPSEPSAASD